MKWARKLFRLPHKSRGAIISLLKPADIAEARLQRREAEAEERKKYKELLKREAIPLIRSYRK